MPSPRIVFFGALFITLTGCVASEDLVPDTDADPDQAQADEAASVLANDPDGKADGVAPGDADGDGIPDATEELLLRRYRPFYKFSQDGGNDEDFRPANPISEIENAQLKTMLPDGGGTTDPIAGCGRDGDHHMTPADTLLTCKTDTSFLATQAKGTYCLNIDNSRYHGLAFGDVQANATGLYGHVAPTTIDGHAAYKIEYWQFFAFNNQDITVLGLGSFGDHEGDWTSVQLWFDRVAQRLVKIRYLIHGKEATFALPSVSPTCRDCMISVQGPSYNPDPGNFFDNIPAYSDNQAEFYVDDHRYKHVVVYIERGAHEFWPGAWGHASQSVGPLSFSLNPHNGSGPSYLVPAVTDRAFNMGEVAHPSTRGGRLIMDYAGYWGCTNTKEADIVGPIRKSPIGPAMHCSWTWPDRGPVAACEH